MEEDEVRERYRRESFPGKDVVEAWRDDVINPLITSLQNESATLEAERWNWNHFYNKFGGLSDIGNQNEFSANKEDFVERHPQIGESLSQHDLLLETLNVAGKELFEKVSNSSFIRDIFTSTTSEESLEALLAANPHTFSGTTAADVVRELFGNDQNEQDRYDIFTEWTINGHWPPNLTRSYVAFWEAYRDRFHALISYPPLNEYRRKVQDIRRELREVNLRIMSMLKLIRKELSERHRIPVEASRSGGQYFFDDFGYPRNRLV